MERPVKERLIGAAVLMAAAVILIPEMLSGPGRDSAEQQAKTAASGEGAIKTYTIDLSQSPGASPAIPTEQPSTSAPPPEELPPPEEVTPPQGTPESSAIIPSTPPAAVSAQATPSVVAETPKPEPRPEPPRQAPPKPVPKPEPKPEPSPPPKTQTQAVASTPSAPKTTVPTGKGWVVQLGSYSSETTAQRLANEWRAKGQSAFVMPVTASGKTLYRVRIGPTKDRADSEAVLKVVKPSVAGAAVVAHP